MARNSQPVPECAGSSQRPPGLRRQPEPSRLSPAPGPPRGHAAPESWEKSFQTALLGADWPRRTRSRGAAANERRGPGAQGRGGGAEVRAAAPSVAAAGAATARPRRQSRGKCRAAAAGGLAPTPGPSRPRGNFCAPPGARRALGPPGRRGAGSLRLRRSLARRFPAAGRWARNSRFSAASLPNFVPSHPCAPASGSSPLPTFFLLQPSPPSLTSSVLLPSSSPVPAAQLHCLPVPSHPRLPSLTPQSLFSPCFLPFLDPRHLLSSCPHLPLIPCSPPSRPLPFPASTLRAGLFPQTSLLWAPPFLRERVWNCLLPSAFLRSLLQDGSDFP